jgi:hypothetical protein
VIAAHDGKDGAFPSAETIAELTGHAEKKLYAVLKYLVTMGILRRDGFRKRAGLNARGPVIYRVQAPPMGIPERDASAMEAPPSTPSTFTTEGTGSATMEIAIGGHEADGCVSARGVGRQRARRVLPRADGAPPTKG